MSRPAATGHNQDGDKHHPCHRGMGTISSQPWIARRVSFPMGKVDSARSVLIQSGGAVITERWRSRAAGTASLRLAIPWIAKGKSLERLVLSPIMGLRVANPRSRRKPMDSEREKPRRAGSFSDHGYRRIPIRRSMKGTQDGSALPDGHVKNSSSHSG